MDQTTSREETLRTPVLSVQTNKVTWLSWKSIHANHIHEKNLFIPQSSISGKRQIVVVGWLQRLIMISFGIFFFTFLWCLQDRLLFIKKKFFLINIDYYGDQYENSPNCTLFRILEHYLTVSVSLCCDDAAVRIPMLKVSLCDLF